MSGTDSIKSIGNAFKNHKVKRDSGKTNNLIKQQEFRDIAYAKEVYRGVKTGDSDAIKEANDVRLKSDGNREATSIFTQAKQLASSYEKQNTKIDTNDSIFNQI